jgi:translation initiation factor IF-3
LVIVQRGFVIKHYIINESIRAAQVRVISADGKQLGVMTRDAALGLARESSLDLVLVSPGDEAPVCKIVDYGKMRYEMMKQEKEARKKQKNSSLKELKLSSKIGEHDYQVVLKKSMEFLAEGHKVKIVLRFKGREVTHPELGARVLNRLIGDVVAAGTPEMAPKLEGKNYFMMLNPK